MFTGLIFAAVVIAWAVFLVPWALRRYDEATRARSVETFSSAMRVLRRSNRTAEAESEAEPETEPAATRPALRLDPDATSTASLADTPRPSRAAARAAAHRRRRVLSALLIVTVGTGMLTVFAVVPRWSVAIPAGLVVGFLALCRWQVRREDDAIWTRRRADPSDPDASSTPLGDEPDDEPTVVLRGASAEARDAGPGRHPVEADAAPVADAELAESTTVAVPVPTADGSALWDPLPVTLPTYVSKAKATRTVRTIDLGQPDAWTSGHVEGEQTKLPSDASASGADSESEKSDEHRPAVGD